MIMNKQQRSASNSLNTGITSNPYVSRLVLEKFIIKNKLLLKKHELSWTRELIRTLNGVTKSGGMVDTVEFLNLVKAKNRRSHRIQGSWYMKVFKTLGASYSRTIFK